eukprot:jgi/Chrzof1/8290/Cz03g05020.t1
MADVLPASADILPSNDNHASDMPPEEEAAQGAQDMHSDHEAQDSQAESLAAPAAEVPDSTDMPDGAADHAEQAEADTDVANLAAPAAEVQEDLGSAPESATATAESASTVGDTANNGDSSIQKPASFKKQVSASSKIPSPFVSKSPSPLASKTPSFKRPSALIAGSPVGSKPPSSVGSISSNPVSKLNSPASKLNSPAGKLNSPLQSRLVKPITKANSAIAAALANAKAAAGVNRIAASEAGIAAVSERPFTLYGKVEVPKPKPQVVVHAPTAEEHARRKQWLAEKEAARQRRLASEAARKAADEARKKELEEAKAAAHRKAVEDRKTKHEDFKKREAELLTKSEASWKQYQQQRGHAPLYKLMEEDYDKRIAAEEAAKKEWYKEEVGKNKMATVSQLVSGEVHIKPPSDTVTRQEFFTRSHPSYQPVRWL